MEFNGKTAIVTGAARGIGRAISLELARLGCNIAFNYHVSREPAERLEAKIAALGRECLSSQMNVADFTAAEEMVKETADRFGKIDYLVNNA